MVFKHLPWEISQRRRTERMYAFSSEVRACPLGIECHFSRQPRQHVAVPCWATKIGWLRIGVCLPSFAWIGGGEALLDELFPVRHHGVQPLAFQVFPFSSTETEPATEGRTSQPAEEFIQIGVHVSVPIDSCLQSSRRLGLPARRILLTPTALHLNPILIRNQPACPITACLQYYDGSLSDKPRFNCGGSITPKRFSNRSISEKSFSTGA